MNAIADAIERARKAGASGMFLKRLTFLLTKKYKHLWRLQLGADSTARVEPLKLTFDEERFPKNVHPRRYSPPQQRFLDAQIAEMERVGILKKRARPGSSPRRSFRLRRTERIVSALIAVSRTAAPKRTATPFP